MKEARVRPDRRGQARHHRRAQAPRQRHGVARGPDRAAHRTHQPPQRPPRQAQEGPPQSPWAVAARRPAASAARLRASQRRRAIPGDRRPQRPPPVRRLGSGPRAALIAYWYTTESRRREGQLPVALLPGAPGGLPTGNWPRRPRLRWPKRRREGERPMADPIVVSGPISGTDTSLTFETGKIAFQSQGAIVATLGKTQVLVTANAARGVREGIDFFPLTVDVEERMYAAGRIPGSFFRREGRPTDLAILTCRLIDRPLRPSFADGYRNETQVVVTVMGVDGHNPYDVLAINGASAALMASGIPFEGPIGAVRIAWSAEGRWVPHPTYEQSENATFDLVVAGRQLDDGDIAIMMVEAGGTESAWQLYQDGTPYVTEEVIAGGLEAAKTWIRESIELQRQLVDAAKAADLITPVEWEPQLDYGDDVYARGEAQVLNVTTLGMPKTDQILDNLGNRDRKRYMHHYNMPPAANGETGRVGSPKRREIGHGLLAERALLPVVPSADEFPYVLRLVSEVLASNGSTSMASVCASTMSLMDAGVPIKAPVAGIAMGLVYAEGKYTTLTDILGAEDAFGDMDFKVAGTSDFVTALQLDTKIDGLPADVLGGALEQAYEARLRILEVMRDAIAEPRPEVGVDDDGMVGRVSIGSSDKGAVEEARRQINLILNPPTAEVGQLYQGRVVNITKFGAFVNILPGRDGLLHI